MSLVSFEFFLFLSITVLTYYTLRPIRKYVLLIASVYFYISISNFEAYKLSVLMAGIFSVTYFGAIAIERANKDRKKPILFLCLAILITILFITKYAYNLFSLLGAMCTTPIDFSWLKFASIIGISYYSLSAIGYLIDVFWGGVASKNPIDIALFIFYFPQLISGPITQFSNMQEQFNQNLTLRYDNFTYGIRRMIWGYFKKLVISDRIAFIVSAVYGKYYDFGFLWIVFATLCYAIQLYTDFSGCMDIIMGASTMMGIKLPENFQTPFYSESVQEFWQRWHITLGLWFKNYFMYPTQKSDFVQKIGKWSKNKLGKKAGKKVSFYVSMILLWILIGIWHGGTGYYFIASALLPCSYLIISDFCQSTLKKFTKQINTTTFVWKFFRRIRTLLLICVCWLFVCSNGTRNAFNVIKQMLSAFWGNANFIETLKNVNGISLRGIIATFLGIIMLFIAEHMTEREKSLFAFLDKKPLFFRVTIIYIEVLMIILCGVLDSSQFIYFQF